MEDRTVIRFFVAVRRSSFVVRCSLFVVPSFVVRRSSFLRSVVHRSSFVVRRSLFLRSSFVVRRSSSTSTTPGSESEGRIEEAAEDEGTATNKRIAIMYGLTQLCLFCGDGGV